MKLVNELALIGVKLDMVMLILFFHFNLIVCEILDIALLIYDCLFSFPILTLIRSHAISITLHRVFHLMI